MFQSTATASTIVHLRTKPGALSPRAEAVLQERVWKASVWMAIPEGRAKPAHLHCNYKTQRHTQQNPAPHLYFNKLLSTDALATSSYNSIALGYRSSSAENCAICTPGMSMPLRLSVNSHAESTAGELPLEAQL